MYKLNHTRHCGVISLSSYRSKRAPISSQARNPFILMHQHPAKKFQKLREIGKNKQNRPKKSNLEEQRGRDQSKDGCKSRIKNEKNLHHVCVATASRAWMPWRNELAFFRLIKKEQKYKTDRASSSPGHPRAERTFDPLYSQSKPRANNAESELR